MIDVSLVIITFNRPKYLKRLLESLMSLSVKPSEIILVNDGNSLASDVISTLNTVRNLGIDVNTVASGFRKGANYCRNIGVAHASKYYITFMDDDDSFDADYFKEFSCTIKILPAVMCFYPSRKFVKSSALETVVRLKSASRVVGLDDLSHGNLIGGTSGVTIAREVFVRSGNFFNEEMPALQDYELWLRLCNSGYYFHPLTLSFVKYTEQETGLQISRSISKWEKSIAIISLNSYFGDKQSNIRFQLNLKIALLKTRFRSSEKLPLKIVCALKMIYLFGLRMFI